MSDDDLTADDRRVLRIEDSEAFKRRGLYAAHDRAAISRASDAALRRRAKYLAQRLLLDTLLCALVIVGACSAVVLLANLLL